MHGKFAPHLLIQLFHFSQGFNDDFAFFHFSTTDKICGQHGSCWNWSSDCTAWVGASFNTCDCDFKGLYWDCSFFCLFDYDVIISQGTCFWLVIFIIFRVEVLLRPEMVYWKCRRPFVKQAWIFLNRFNLRFSLFYIFLFPLIIIHYYVWLRTSDTR